MMGKWILPYHGMGFYHITELYWVMDFHANNDDDIMELLMSKWSATDILGIYRN